jgi:hypothetical protein
MNTFNYDLGSAILDILSQQVAEVFFPDAFVLRLLLCIGLMMAWRVMRELLKE